MAARLYHANVQMNMCIVTKTIQGCILPEKKLHLHPASVENGAF